MFGKFRVEDKRTSECLGGSASLKTMPKLIAEGANLGARAFARQPTRPEVAFHLRYLGGFMLTRGCFDSPLMENQHVVKRLTQFQIRPARVEDVPVILELIRDLATYERAPDEVTATEEQLVEVMFGERPAAEVLLAFEGKLPVGFAVYFYNFSTWLGRPGLYLEDLFVKPEKRGKGYGRAFLVELAKIARDRGCGRMEWAVLDWNEPAIKFYRSLGAKPMDEWTVFRLTRDEIAELAGGKQLEQE
jgi:GNAT superfamily N-acetyltransferase